MRNRLQTILHVDFARCRDRVFCCQQDIGRLTDRTACRVPVGFLSDMSRDSGTTCVIHEWILRSSHHTDIKYNPEHSPNVQDFLLHSTVYRTSMEGRLTGPSYPYVFDGPRPYVSLVTMLAMPCLVLGAPRQDNDDPCTQGEDGLAPG